MKNDPTNIGEFMTVSWGDTSEESITSNVQWGDENTLSLLGVKVIEGDSLRNVPMEGVTASLMINESFAKILRQQIPDITFPYKQFMGVFGDFQHRSIKEPITPLALGSIYNNGGDYGTAFIKINANELEKTLVFIEKTFKELYPDQLYEFDFLDKKFSSMYKSEQMFRSRLLTFSLLAIFIGCLGLFALVGYSVERRAKEIAIRKVYGSTVLEILTMLSIGFLKWLIISFVIAAPIIYYVGTLWVEQYAYRTGFSWWIFAVALLVSMVVALITVLTQAYKAAVDNPANAVKR